MIDNYGHPIRPFPMFSTRKFDDDRTFQGAWHVFVGKHFGAWVTYEACSTIESHGDENWDPQFFGKLLGKTIWMVIFDLRIQSKRLEG